MGIQVNMASAGLQARLSARRGLTEQDLQDMMDRMANVYTKNNRIYAYGTTGSGGTQVSTQDIRITDYMGKGGKCLLVECSHYKRWSEGSDVGVCQECSDYCKTHTKARIQKVVEYSEVMDRILGNNGAKIAGPEIPEENMKYTFRWSGITSDL